jgi:hypothetical protein
MGTSDEDRWAAWCNDFDEVERCRRRLKTDPGASAEF